MNSTVFVHEFTAMASQCQVTLAGISREEALSLAGQAEAEVRRIERKYSRYREDSVVADINRMAGVSAVTCDEETLTLLDNAALLYAHSEGLFDITSGVLRRARQFDSRVPPSTEALHAVLPLIGWHKVQREGTQVMLPEAGMEIDFGGFGKEYATDRAAALLRRAGVRSGHVNLGGDLHVLGPKPDGSPWMIGIRHPRQGTHPLATIPLSEGALATSGDYERYFIHEGTRYCHILNRLPRHAQRRQPEHGRHAHGRACPRFSPRHRREFSRRIPRRKAVCH